MQRTAAPTRPDLAELYRQMVRARALEEISAELWHDGLVSGELHSGVGEEAVAAGVVGQLGDGDAVVTDHRPTPPLLVRGVDPEEVLLELLGSEAGLCGGYGGHMHLLDRDRLAVSDGIVGASAPMACGFALRAQLDGSQDVAVAFFGEGAANQGMLLEALNLAAVWKLPVVFVCKDSGLAITSRRRETTAARLVRRSRGFGMPAASVRGADVTAVWRAARRAIDRARRGRGPTFLRCRVHRPEGHLLGDPLLRAFRDPLGQAGELGPPLARSLRAEAGAPVGRRLAAVGRVGVAMGVAGREALLARLDPLVALRRALPADVAGAVEDDARAEMDAVRAAALAKVNGSHG